eukprot:5303663-Pyramimonas_sp.AAC.1
MLAAVASPPKTGLGGLPTLTDIVHGPLRDMTKAQNQQTLLNSVQTGRVKGVMFLAPFHALSRSRRGCPPPLRSND